MAYPSFDEFVRKLSEESDWTITLRSRPPGSSDVCGLLYFHATRAEWEVLFRQRDRPPQVLTHSDSYAESRDVFVAEIRRWLDSGGEFRGYVTADSPPKWFRSGARRA